MNDGNDYIELVERAQFGSRESLDSLAQKVRGRLYAYVYRIILKDDISQDIVQESLLEMFSNIDKLKKAELFWPWLRGIAFNKIRRHYTREKRHKVVSLSSYGDWLQPRQKDEQAGPFKLMGDEIRQIVFDAMKQLKPHYRAVLAMRCYEEMKYSQIAKLMGGSELRTRVLFCRAKEALHKQLSRKGFGKGFLLSALALFGRMTAPAEAASSVTVTASATGVGMTATLVAAASSKTTVVTTIAAVGAVTAGTVLAPASVDKAVMWADALRQRLARPPVVAPEPGTEYWYYYPAKTNGPVMTRLIKRDPKTGRFYCQRLENDSANYYFDEAANTIHIDNSRMFRGDLSVRRLPTDNADLTEFLAKLEGGAQKKELEYISGEHNGVLVISEQGGDNIRSHITHHYNVLDEEYFRYDWPAGAKVIDNRDAMHKRGWTYFRITGHINGEEVSGTGRIPFVYAAGRRHRPWLRLNVSDRLEVVDCCGDTRICDGQGKVLITCPAGSFFKGLARPWMGLHTIDTIRRDAAEQQLPFETSYTPQSPAAEVIVISEQSKIIYTIDMDKDVIEKIVITGDGTDWNEKAELRFSYLDDVEQVGDEFAEPGRKDYTALPRQEIGMLWLIRLTEGEWD